MAVIETWFCQDLQKAVKVNHIDGNLFTHNGNGNRIGVRVYNDGEPVTLTGTVSGYVITSDGSTVPCVGARSGNKATITIPPAAYQPGNAFITIFLTEGSTVTTLCAAQTTVLQARTGSQVSPGSVVQDWTQTINAAMQSVENAAENLGGIIATPYASLTYPVPLGKYTYYNNGLYRCISPIASSEEFTAAHWTQVRLGDDVSDLKSALNYYNSDPLLAPLADGSGSRNGIAYTIKDGVYTMSGTATAGGYIVRLYYKTSVIPEWLKAGKKIYIRLNKSGDMEAVYLTMSRFYSGTSGTFFDSRYEAEEFVIPDLVYDGLSIALIIDNTLSCNGTIKPEILSAPSNIELAERINPLEEVAQQIPEKLQASTFDNFLEYEDIKTRNSNNIFNVKTITENYKLRNTGYTQYDNGWWVSDFIPINTGDLVICTVNGLALTLNNYCTYNSEKEFIAYHQYIRDTEITDENVAYIRVSAQYTVCDPRISKLQLQTGAIKDYEPYGVWFSSGNIQKTVAIAPTGGDYSSIRTALETEGENTEFLIYPGTYNVGDEITSEEIENSSYDSAGNGFVGVRVKDGCILRGVGDKRNIVIKCELDTSAHTYTKRENIATLNLFGGCTIENLTVLAINARTPIHDDFSANANKTHIIRNCVLRNEVSERVTSHGYGLGLKSGENVIMEGCDIYPTMICHSNTNFTNPASLKMTNCQVFSNLTLQDLASVRPVYVDLINTTYGTLTCLSNNTNKAMQIRIASETDSPVCLLNDTDIDGYMYTELPARYAVAKGQLVAYSRTGAFNATDMYRVAATADPVMAIGVAKNDAAIGEAVSIVKLNKYLGSFECGIASVALGDRIGIDQTWKLVVDPNGTFGTVVLMIADGIGIIKLI